MKKVMSIFEVTLFTSILLTSCGNNSNDNNSENQPQSSILTSDTSPKILNDIDTSKSIQPRKIEKNLNVNFKTQLVAWGGDGKWHDMYKNDNGSYWVNYLDPFKIILTGNYTDLTIKLTSSSGSIIFEKSNVQIPENGEYIISDNKMIGEPETNFSIEIKENNKFLLKGKIESVPGGE